MTINRTRMPAALQGFINAPPTADYLVRKGLPFRDAYTVIGRIVAECVRRGCTLETMTLEEYRAFSPLFDDDVFKAVRLETCVANRQVPGGPAPKAVEVQLEGVRKFLEERGVTLHDEA